MSNKVHIFKGVATALITPFSDGKIDYAALEKIIEMQIDGGINGLVFAGTTGESATLDESEQRELFNFAVKTVKNRVPVIVGAGGCDTARSIRLSRYASAVGCDALLTVTPYYNKASDEGLVRNFTAIASNSDIPIILYNVPARTGVNLNEKVLCRLADNEKIVGIKEASGSVCSVSSILSLFADKFDIYSGNDDIIIPIMSLGGCGVISVISNIMPYKVSKMCRLFDEGDRIGSLQLQLDCMKMIKLLFAEVNPIPIKYAMYLLGLCRAEYRLPLCEPAPSLKQKLACAVAEYGLI